MKTTIAAIEIACSDVERLIASYRAEKAALGARRDAGEITYPACEKARLAASVPASRAVKAFVALCGSDLAETPSEALMARCDAIDEAARAERLH